MGEIDKTLLERLDAITRLTNASKWQKMMHHPARYIRAQGFRYLQYPITGMGKMAVANTFFDEAMTVQLPSAMDIYLWGAKTHDSEMRLARFLIRHLKEADEFMDVGVHFGFFSLLAAKLVTEKGKVISIEASPEMFAIFRKNIDKASCITPLNVAATATEKMIDFFEFPILYSEYNTLFPEQYNQEQWYQKLHARKVSIRALPLDKIIKDKQLHPSIIKIDVEGAEADVLQGLEQYLAKCSPMVVMEYLDRASHRSAIKLAQTWGYTPFSINSEGLLNNISDFESFWRNSVIDSDNIVLSR